MLSVFWFQLSGQQPGKEKWITEKYVPEGTSANTLKKDLWMNYLSQHQISQQTFLENNLRMFNSPHLSARHPLLRIPWPLCVSSDGCRQRRKSWIYKLPTNAFIWPQTTYTHACGYMPQGWQLRMAHSRAQGVIHTTERTIAPQGPVLL